MNVERIQTSAINITQQQRLSSSHQFDELVKNKVSEVKDIQATKNQNDDVLLTNDERKFFEKLYPQAANDVRAYHAYRRDGSRVAVTTGTLIDRKG